MECLKFSRVLQIFVIKMEMRHASYGLVQRSAALCATEFMQDENEACNHSLKK